MKINPFRRKRKLPSLDLGNADDVFTLWAIADLVDLIISMSTDN